MDPEPAAADNGGDNAQSQMVVLKIGALLDVRLQVAAVTGGIHLLPRSAGEPSLPQRIPQRQTSFPIGADIDLLLRHQAAE